MWVVIVWSIWIHRNNIIFRSKVKDVEEIFNLAQVKTWTWITNKVPKTSFFYSDWCLCSITCIKFVGL